MPKNIFTRQEAKECCQLFDAVHYGIGPKVVKEERTAALLRIADFLDAAAQQAPDARLDPEV